MNGRDGRDPECREQRKLELISQEAAEWFLRLKDPRPSRQDRREFFEWLIESRRHVAEYLRIVLMHGRLRRLKLDACTAFPGQSNVVNLNLRSQVEAGEVVRPVLRRWQRRMAAAAAGLVLMFPLGAIVQGAWLERSIHTDLGEWRHVTLADGSAVRMGPRTRLRFEFGDARRSVYLHGGEAYFEVAKDPARPFVVNAEPVVVRAVGTQFAVTRHGREVTVTVAEGAVRVAPSGAAVAWLDHASRNLSVPLTESEQISTSGRWPVAVRRIEVAHVLAWKDKRLIFHDGATLAHAIAAFNTRNRLQLEASDPQV
ncbi:MAG: FecR family protein, partial [Steroidobacteraceae bacterium]